MRRPAIALATMASVLLVGAGAAQAVSLKRHEDQYWVWYAPKGWVAAQGRAGIDLSSATGVLHVGYAFSGWPAPLAHQDVVDLVVRSGGLDQHPLRSVAIIGSGRPYPFAGGQRKIIQWKAYRTDRREWIRGTLKVDVFNDYATGTFGFAGTEYAAPKRQWKKWKRTLEKVSKAVFYKPQSPV